MSLLALPHDLLQMIVALLPLKAEAALLRTCKKARDRCKGQLHFLALAFRRLSDAEKVDVGAHLLACGFKRKSPLVARDPSDAIKRSRWLTTKPDIAGHGIPCTFPFCNRSAAAMVSNAPRCKPHAVEEFCETCGADAHHAVLALCVLCGSRVCDRCVRRVERTTYCEYCSRRTTVEENYRFSGVR